MKLAVALSVFTLGLASMAFAISGGGATLAGCGKCEGGKCPAGGEKPATKPAESASLVMGVQIADGCGKEGCKAGKCKKCKDGAATAPATQSARLATPDMILAGCGKCEDGKCGTKKPTTQPAEKAPTALLSTTDILLAGECGKCEGGGCGTKKPTTQPAEKAPATV